MAGKSGKSVFDKKSYTDLEKKWLAAWQADQTFVKSISGRSPDRSWVFYDGPPFITGMPHPGTLLSSIAKDVLPRFQTMLGRRVERRWGWDCHGLPAENLVEKKLGLADKQAVLDYGLANYTRVCQDSMVETSSLWRDPIDRIGRWVDFDGAYKTMAADYMESVWWAFKKLYDDGLIYEGEKVLVYCSRCATPVSKAEVAMDNAYLDVADTSVYVTLALTSVGRPPAWPDREPVLALAWTTTPWTLPANSGLAVNGRLNYSLVKFSDRLYLLAQDSCDRLLGAGNYQTIAVVAGSELTGLTYDGLFGPVAGGCRLLAADYVSSQAGSGLVHLAPAYGEDDYQLALSQQLPVIKIVDDYGRYVAGPWAGSAVWSAQPAIIDHLKSQGRLFKTEVIDHSYPHCHRCRTRLIYKVHPSWFLDIAAIKAGLMAKNKSVTWFPEHIKDGRFAKTVDSAPDWNISRDRFWATPLPVWRATDEAGQVQTIVVGSYEQLEQLSGVRLADYHRPFVDRIVFEKDGLKYQRIDKVIDCWFESGSMPFAQFHYPFENQAKFQASLPADYVVEYVGQVRAWFYYLQVLSLALFDSVAFKNVIVTGTITGSDGRKVSKSLGNYQDPMTVIDRYGADAYRLTLMTSVVMQAQDFSLTDKDISDRARQLERLRNVLGFLVNYAQADNWSYPEKPTRPDPTRLLDRWLMVRLDQLTGQVTTGLLTYNLPAAWAGLADFIDDLSNWYVRRSRVRFWKNRNDQDKDQAYQTLYYVLRQLALLLAPICPFLAEEIKQELAGSGAGFASIHLDDWPDLIRLEPAQSADRIKDWPRQLKVETLTEADLKLLALMKQVRAGLSLALAARVRAGLKVRQPLARLIWPGTGLEADLIDLIKAEVNVKQVVFEPQATEVVLDTSLTAELRSEAVIRELVRLVQAQRKQANLALSDRIELTVTSCESLIMMALENFGDYLKTETLTSRLTIVNQAPDPAVAQSLTVAETPALLVALALVKAA